MFEPKKGDNTLLELSKGATHKAFNLHLLEYKINVVVKLANDFWTYGRRPVRRSTAEYGG